jgi:hypothetical protein
MTLIDLHLSKAVIMLIPSTFYGLYREVKPRCRKIVTKLKRGTTWETIFAEDTYLDTQMYSNSHIVMSGPNPNYGFEPHFHCYVLHREIDLAIVYQKMNPKCYEDIFTASLKTPWGLLGLFAPEPSGWLRRFPGSIIIEDRLSRFFSACLESWDVFDAEGRKYGTCCNKETIWSHHCTFNLLLSAALKKQELPAYESRFRVPDARISKEDLRKLVDAAQQGIHLMCQSSG